MSALRRLGAMLVCAALAVLTAPAAPAQGGPTPAGEEALTSRGVERLLADLREREVDLERRELEVNQRERSIGDLEAQVEKRVEELDALRAEVERRIASWEEKSGDRVARLAKVYSAMPPAKAAPLLQELELDLATSIVSRMREKTSAAILAQMPRSHALRLSQRFARPLRGPEAGAR